MSIASELTNLENNIGDSYDAVNDMGGIIPAQRNMDNLDQAIRTIPQSQGTTYTAGYGIDIDQNDEISVDTSVIAEKTDIPTNTSDLTNDGSDGSSTYVEASDLAAVATSGDYGDLLNTPTVPTNTSDLTNDGDDGLHPFLATDDVATVATSGLYSDLTGTPTIPAAQVNSDWNANSGVAQILNKPSLATVATSGAYSDLTGTPTIPAAQIQSDWTQTTTTALDYIKNKPEIRHVNSVSDAGWSADANKLVDGSVLAYWNGAYSGTASNLKYLANNCIGANHFNQWSTANTSDTWVPVCNGNNIQHRVIKTFNSDGSIPASAIADSAVTTAKINNSAVTTAKLATSTWVNGSYKSGYKASTNTNYKQNIQATIVGRMLYIRFGVSPSSGSFAKDTEYTFGSIPSTVNGVTVSGLCTAAKQNIPRFLCGGQYGIYGWCQLNGTDLTLSFNSSFGNSCGWMCGQLMIPIDY